MKCPVCQTIDMEPTSLDRGLPAFTCEDCGGIWVSSTQYFDWLDEHGSNLPERPYTGQPLHTPDPNQAKICPDCGHLLRRYKVWPDVEFSLDHCNTCNGIWFDANEWEVIVARNLHDDLHTFFTKSWQEKLRKIEARHREEAIYLARFGPDDYARIQDIRKWLDDHPRRAALLAFLQAEDPYQP